MAAIRVLIVDDSATVRAVVRRMLGGSGEVEVAGEAADGAAAVEAVGRLRPDLVLMDLEMPVLDGMSAIARIMATRPTPILVLTSRTQRDTALAFQAMRAGAVDLLPKPIDPEGWQALRRILPELAVETTTTFARRLGGPPAAGQAAGQPVGASPDQRGSSSGQFAAVAVDPPGGAVGAGTAGGPRRGEPAPVASRALTASEAAARRSTAIPAGARARWVAIGASTGGPVALHDLFAALPPDPPATFLVVQHITAGFEAGLAEWLARDLRRDVRVARDGEEGRQGAIRLAPNGAHLVLGADGCLHLDSQTAPRGPHRPAVDELFASCARMAPRDTVGILMTGMGKDGADGLLALRRAGGMTMVQDADTAAVFGMPRVALERGAAELALPPGEMARLLARMWRLEL